MDGSEGPAKAPVIIKKYANRRLYNTAKSSYVTLDNLSEMVREGEDFVVYDAKSGDDITRSVLTQIIFEEEAKGTSMLPASFLRQIIRLYGDALQSVVPGYLEASMETFARNQEKMREQMRATFGPNPALATFETMARTNMEWFQRAMAMLSPHAPQQGGDAGEAPKPGTKAAADEELEAMKQRLMAMQSQLDKISKGS